jgi:hypothetical protein
MKCFLSQGSGDISPLGELYALRYLSSYFGLLSSSIASQPAGPSGTSTIQAALSLVKKESLVSIISLLILPEVTVVMSHFHSLN